MCLDCFTHLTFTVCGGQKKVSWEQISLWRPSFASCRSLLWCRCMMEKQNRSQASGDGFGRNCCHDSLPLRGGKPTQTFNTNKWSLILSQKAWSHFSCQSWSILYQKRHSPKEQVHRYKKHKGISLLNAKCNGRATRESVTLAIEASVFGNLSAYSWKPHRKNTCLERKTISWWKSNSCFCETFTFAHLFPCAWLLCRFVCRRSFPKNES